MDETLTEDESAGRRQGKSEAAFRTISEVSTDLGVPQHVLRFWETRFSQIRPMKRGGGRRYYRPEDVRLLEAIRDLLYNDGYTIRGAQKLLRENGLRAVLNLAAGGASVEAESKVPEKVSVTISAPPPSLETRPQGDGASSLVQDQPDVGKDIPLASPPLVPPPAAEQAVKVDPLPIRRPAPVVMKRALSSAPTGPLVAKPASGNILDDGQLQELGETLRELEDLRSILRQAGL